MLRKPRAARMRRGGEKTIVSRMPTIHVRMRHAAEDGEIIAMSRQSFEIGRKSVITPAFAGKKWSGKTPRLLQMPKNRRGFPPGVADAARRLRDAANTGLIASSRGSERRIPASRRNFAGRVASQWKRKGCSFV